MASHSSPTVPVESEPLRPTVSPQPRRPLQREGARIFLSVTEQTPEDAMMRRSPSPETPERVLGKRRRSGDGSDTEPDVEPCSTTQMKSSSTCHSKATAATLPCAMKKKLRPEQRSEVQAFMSDTALGRVQYGAGEDFVMGDAIAGDWQQPIVDEIAKRVDAV